MRTVLSTTNTDDDNKSLMSYILVWTETTIIDQVTHQHQELR